MLVLDKDNSYGFANTVVKVTDNTASTTTAITPVPPTPNFNVLIPTVQSVGKTNEMTLFYPGEADYYLSCHGEPNCIKYGFGPDFIHGILASAGANVGVYTINLRGETATKANTVVCMKYKVEADVPYTDADGKPYYVGKDGELTTNQLAAGKGGKAVKRDVLHTKFVSSYVENVAMWTDIHAAMNSLYSDVADDDGYKTIPVFAIMYRGASTHGNSVYFGFTPAVAEYDGNMYYTMNMFDGVKATTTDSTLSFDTNAGANYGANYFIENTFNETYPTMQFMTSESIEDVYNVFNKHLFTLEDYIAGNQTPSMSFSEIDMFSFEGFGVVLDEGSVNAEVTNAFVLNGGFDGNETRDELFEQFFAGKLVKDITSVLRYRIIYIPDIGYNDATKANLISLVDARNHMTSATIMVGGYDTFASALIDHQANYYKNKPNIRQLAAVQNAMMYNGFVRRTVTYPATYFDTMSLMAHFAKWGNNYQPFAGYGARWIGYIDDTMTYPDENVETVNAFYNNRINLVMKDAEAGAYLADQRMNCDVSEDQGEFNNAFLVSCMLYDLLELIHKNHFKFNEADDVRAFQEGVDECINTNYKQYSASISLEVYRMGTIGRAKSTNKVVVTIDLKDINRYTNVEIILTEE